MPRIDHAVVGHVKVLRAVGIRQDHVAVHVEVAGRVNDHPSWSLVRNTNGWFDVVQQEPPAPEACAAR